MKTPYRYLFLLLAALVCGFAFSPALAGDSADQIIARVKNRPCGRGWNYDPGNAYHLPLFTCRSYQGVNARLHLLVRDWVVDPQYPFVGEHFFLGLEQYGNPNGYSFPSRTIAWDETIQFVGFQVKLRAVPVETTLPGFNGYFAHDPSILFTTYWEEPTWLTDMETELSLTSGADIAEDRYPRGAKDTTVLALIAHNSSYHAGDSTTFQGEPAYRLEVHSTYLIEAQASWDYYRKWVVSFQDRCIAGPNTLGDYDCSLADGTPGHWARVDTSHWGNTRHDTRGGGGWKPVQLVETNLVRWPDNRYRDHLPILVFQSMPLLQKP